MILDLLFFIKKFKLKNRQCRALILISFFMSFLYEPYSKELILGQILLMASITDIEAMTLPNLLNNILFIFCLFNLDPEALVLGYDLLLSSLLLVFLAVISLASESLGFADVRALISLFIILGPQRFMGLLFTSFILAFIYALCSYVKVRDKRQELPFIPFIYISFLILGVL